MYLFGVLLKPNKVEIAGMEAKVISIDDHLA